MLNCYSLPLITDVSSIENLSHNISFEVLETTYQENLHVC